MKMDWKTKVIKASPAKMSRWLRHITQEVPQHFPEREPCFVFRGGAKLVYEGTNSWRIYGHSKHARPTAFIALTQQR